MQQREPAKSCLLALKEIILLQDREVTAAWKYGMPFFCYRGKMFCYLWLQKKTGRPYLGLVEGGRFSQPELIVENRSRMKILPVDPQADLPLALIATLLNQALDLYRTGIIPIKH